MKSKRPSKSLLIKLFWYNNMTGRLMWRERAGDNAFNARYANKAAGFNDKGRIRVSIAGKIYYNANLVWIYHNGSIKKGNVIDHITRNTMDDRLQNLRSCTISQNACNRTGTSKTGYKGVTKSKCGKYIARITKNGKCFYLGMFSDASYAADIYDKAAKKLHNKFAKINFPEIK
jgi:hypothetical protein